MRHSNIKTLTKTNEIQNPKQKQILTSFLMRKFIYTFQCTISEIFYGVICKMTPHACMWGHIILTLACNYITILYISLMRDHL